MNDISKPSVRGTTGLAGRVGGGSPVTSPERQPEFGWRVSIRAELAFRLWEATTRLRHVFGRHTFIDVEDWSSCPNDTDGDGNCGRNCPHPIQIVAQECWLCPARM